MRAYLDALAWDGVARVDGWLSTYAGADDAPAARATGTRWLLSAVARVFEPGCKVDTVLILEGRQGLYKSSLLRALADPWFSDTPIELGTKDGWPRRRPPRRVVRTVVRMGKAVRTGEGHRLSRSGQRGDLLGYFEA